MKKRLHISFLFVLLILTVNCHTENDNSKYFPDFEMNPGEDAPDPKTDTSIRIATYNIQVQSGSAWNNRKAQLVNLIKTYNFELCGIEEASWEQRSFLASQLSSSHDIVAYGRDTGNDDSKAGEMTAILYDNKRFSLLESGRFWFSETPDIPSNGWDETNYKRFCVWAKFKAADQNKEFYIFKSHMPLAELARKNACSILVQKVSEIVPKDMPAFCLGDFNTTPETDEIAVTIGKSGILKDAYGLVSDHIGPSYTFPSKKTRIDFIFVKDADVLFYRTIDSVLSDHLPVVIVAEL